MSGEATGEVAAANAPKKMSKYAAKKARQAEAAKREREAVRIEVATAPVAAPSPAPKAQAQAPAPAPKPSAKPCEMTERDAALIARAKRRISDAAIALAEAHAIVKAAKTRSKGEVLAVLGTVTQVTGAAWTRSCGALVRICQLDAIGAVGDTEAAKEKEAAK